MVQQERFSRKLLGIVLAALATGGVGIFGVYPVLQRPIVDAKIEPAQQIIAKPGEPANITLLTRNRGKTDALLVVHVSVESLETALPKYDYYFWKPKEPEKVAVFVEHERWGWVWNQTIPYVNIETRDRIDLPPITIAGIVIPARVGCSLLRPTEEDKQRHGRKST
nr:hypothetical protein [Candidatus Njordarchaeum guaymaensis]